MPLDPAQIGLLGQSLDRARVKTRGGRGGGSFSYLETHDMVRTANEIFGYGQWGHAIAEQDRIGEIEVENRDGKKGWHVAYRCVVVLTVAGCVPVSGSGYGDAVEYGPAARLTASELALKESESDALKRALKNYGDQFGLILYAKAEDAKRLESQQAADQSRATGYPVSVTESIARLQVWVSDGIPWVKEAVGLQYQVESVGALDDTQRIDLIKRLQTVIAELEATVKEPLADVPATVSAVQTAFANAFDHKVSGPENEKGGVPF